jgi:hypothetical protein
LTIGLNAPSLAAHVPLTQVVVGPQTVLQFPQWLGSLLRSAHPDAQQVWVAEQAGPPLQSTGATHAPITQVLPVGQTWPQEPQLLTSFVSSTQPVAQHLSEPVQAGPPLQVAWHIPPAQTLPAGQAMPQPPQFFTSVLVFEHPVVQHCCAPMQAGPPLQVGVHMLFTQLEPGPHTMPQPPQFFESLAVAAHPVAQHVWVAEQAGPPLQVAVHMLFTQLSPTGQTMLQPPQFFGSELIVEHPLAQQVWAPVQPIPPLQPVVHIPLTQAWLGPQNIPQPPQLLGSLLSSTHWLKQFWSGPGQTMPLHTSPPPGCGKQHPPAWQRFAPAGQALPQPPQLARSFWVSMHLVPQHVLPAGQPVIWQFTCWQVPAMHDAPAAQALPQVPQFFGSVLVLTSQPSPTCLSQSAKPALHALMWQALARQAVLPLVTGPHTVPQAPQLFESLAVFAQVTPQQVWLDGQAPPLPQAPTQTPPEHDSPTPQALPQPPQLAGSVCVSISQPSKVAPSQSAKPPSQAPITQVEAAQSAVACGNGPQTMPQPPQSRGFVASSTQSGSQQVRPALHEAPPPQKPTHSKFEHTSPLGHWLFAVHCTHTCVSSRQCGLGAAQSASVLQPTGAGTHLCVVGSQASPAGQLSGEVVQPPEPPEPPVPTGERSLRLHAATASAAASSRRA